MKPSPPFPIPGRATASPRDRQHFDRLEASLGAVPNLYAALALHNTALSDFLNLQDRESTLSREERLVINLVVSQVNECRYSIPFHTHQARTLGLSDKHILEIRAAQISFNTKLQVLARFVKEAAINKGRPAERSIDALFEAGYHHADLVDIVMQIGEVTITNYLHNITLVPLDFPDVPLH